MVYEFKFPDVGEGITEGKLVHWHVKPGDSIEEDDVVAEVETDKSVVEIPSPKSGKIEKLFFKENSDVKLGDIILTINDGENSSLKTNEVVEKDTKISQNSNKNDEFVNQKSKKIKNKKELSKNESLAKSNQNDSFRQFIKALPKVRLEARKKGIDINALNVSKNIVTLKDLNLDKNEIKTAENDKKSFDNKDNNRIETNKSIIASPSTRKYARLKGVDITELAANSNKLIITKEHIDNFSSNESTEKIDESKNNSQILNQDKTIKMSSIRKVIAKRMEDSIQHGAQLTHFEEANVDYIDTIKNKYKEQYKNEDISLTYLPFFIKALVSSLKKHPILNSIINKDNIILKSNINLGVAVNTSDGLFVPVIKNIENYSILEIAKEIKKLATKAHEKKLSKEEMSNGTFTLTSIGKEGTLGFTPILNEPESAILGIGRIDKKPIIKNNEVCVGKVITLSLTYDHRVLDGADAAKFLHDLKTNIENFEKLFLEMN